jgi:WhiB family redox-sensing transcriptional regulator
MEELAACSGAGANLFFSTEVDEINAAVNICTQQCLIRLECLEEAIARREPCGVWGGFLFKNGHIVGNVVRDRGRPAQHRSTHIPRLSEVPVHLQPDIFRYKEFLLKK